METEGVTMITNNSKKKRRLAAKFLSLILSCAMVFTAMTPVVTTYCPVYADQELSISVISDAPNIPATSAAVRKQSFFTRIVRKVSSCKPLCFMGKIVGFGITAVLKRVISEKLGPKNQTDPTIEEIKADLEKIMSELDTVAQKQDQILDELSALSTMVECAELNNALNSYEKLKSQNWAPSAIYRSVKLEESSDYTDEEKNERIKSALLGGMGFGSDYTSYNRTDIAYDNYVFQLGNAIMGPYKVTFKDKSGVSTKTGNIFWIYYESQRRAVSWEHQADESRAAFNNDVLSTYLLTAFLDLLSLGARISAIEEYNASRDRGERYVSDTPVRQMMTQLQEQMYAVAEAAEEWQVDPGSETPYYWVPGHEMRFNSGIETTTIYDEYMEVNGKAKDEGIPIVYDEMGGYSPVLKEDFADYTYNVFTRFHRNSEEGILIAPEEMNILFKAYSSDKDSGTADEDNTFWEYLRDSAGFSYEKDAPLAAGSKALMPLAPARGDDSCFYGPHVNPFGKGVYLRFAAWNDQDKDTIMHDKGICAGWFDESIRNNLYECYFGPTAQIPFPGWEESFHLIHLTGGELNHSLERHEGRAATCSQEGQESYYSCSTCGKWFSDAFGYHEIEKDEKALVIPKTDHWWTFTEFTWEINEDVTAANKDRYKSVKAEYVCSRDNSHKMSVDAAVTKKEINGNLIYTVTVSEDESPDGIEHTDTRGVTAEEDATVFTGFTWYGSDADGYRAAWATYKDASGKDIRQNATVEKKVSEPTCEEDGYTEYTAKIYAADSPDGLYHSKTKTIRNKPKLGHHWIFDGFVWAEGEDGALEVSASYTCARDASHSCTKDLKAEVKKTAATCCTYGKTTYIASISASQSPDGKEHSEKKDSDIELFKNHDWEFTGFTWHGPSADDPDNKDGFSYAEANFKCRQNEDHKMSVPVATDFSTKDNTTAVYTAALAAEDSPDGTAHNDAREVPLKEDITAPFYHEFELFRFDIKSADDEHKKAYANFKEHTDSQDYLSVTVAADLSVIDTPQCAESPKILYMASVDPEKSPDGLYHMDFFSLDSEQVLNHDWEFTGFTWIGYEESGYTAALAEYSCKRDPLHLTQVLVYPEVSATAPTCQQSGKRTYTVTVKALQSPDYLKHTETISLDIPAARSHVPGTMPAKDPTCTRTGLTEGSKCQLCGEVLTPQEKIPALGHIPDVFPGKAPTETETGLTEGSRCAVCGAILVPQTIIPATGSKTAVESKIANTAVIKGKTVKVSRSAVRKKSVKKKVISVSKAKGAVTYKIKKGSKAAKKALKLNKRTGKVTVKKGTKAGTYKLKIRVTVAGDSQYKAKSKTVTIRVKVI